ncbi:hypothetical protein FPR_22230 [Faecalibacterium prausnitzii SL3/3]|uniref:Uncharacterized protein n=1 Tax=Faecalibacterium prausnitzii SL3/3 TaxID=657322 RepID=D4KC47_9FIRM|nr:hypothetical protein FPR_22230 [Faecalibacterium prausnitzii SL3/3]
MVKKRYVNILTKKELHIFANIALKIAKTRDSFLLIFIFRRKILALNMMDSNILYQLGFVKV